MFNFLSLPHGGGTVDILYRLSKTLAERGHSVAICTGDYELDQDYLDTLTDVDIHLFRSRFNKHGIFVMPDLLQFDVGPYDVIHLHCYRSYQNAVICGKAARRSVPYIIDAHGSTVDLPGMKQLLRRTYDLVLGLHTLRHARAVVAETEVGVTEYKRLGVGANKIRLLHPLLDTDEFANLPKPGLFRNRYSVGSRFLILFIGRVHPMKGIEALVRATCLLVSRGLDAHLAIVGQDEGSATYLLRVASLSGIADRVLFTGFLTGVDKLSALMDADVLVQPSRNEAGARPSLEAILCGTPVAVTAGTGAGNEIAKFDGGILFNYGDTDALVSALLYIAANRGIVGSNTARAKKYIEDNLSLGKQVARYEELYREVLL